MANAGKIVLRVVFVLCLVLVLIGDYLGLLDKVLGVGSQEGQSRPPRPTNPGYGDTKADIDLDADIEDDSIKNLGKGTHLIVHCYRTVAFNLASTYLTPKCFNLISCSQGHLFN